MEDLIHYRCQMLHVLVRSVWSELASSPRDGRLAGGGQSAILLATEKCFAEL